MRSDLTTAVTEIETHAAERGWDQPPRLYALARTADLLAREPALAERLGISDEPRTGALTPIEQQPLPPETPLDETLAGIAWPDEVSGCALVVERLMLPPSAEAELAAESGAAADVNATDEGSSAAAPPVRGDSEKDLREWASRRPDREEVRLVVGVLRDGSRESALRLRSHDTRSDVLSGPDLVPALAEALAATLT